MDYQSVNMEDMNGLLLAINKFTTSFLKVSRFFSKKLVTSYQTSPERERGREEGGGNGRVKGQGNRRKKEMRKRGEKGWEIGVYGEKNQKKTGSGWVVSRDYTEGIYTII